MSLGLWSFAPLGFWFRQFFGLHVRFEKGRSVSGGHRRPLRPAGATGLTVCSGRKMERCHFQRFRV